MAIRYRAGMNEMASRGVRVLVALHDIHLRLFFETWRRAKAEGALPPARGDADYATLDTLLRHVLGAARGYVVWCCEVLGLPDPGIREAPPAERIAAEADAYLEHVLEGWPRALALVPPERLEDRTYPSRWGTPYCIDAMLEHAVMHPIRHAFQLEEMQGA